MPYKPKAVEMPEWIFELSIGDQCLKDVLSEAWVAAQYARKAVLQRGNKIPLVCSRELEAAEGIVDSIREGRVPGSRLAKKAAQAVRKFDMVYQCAQFLERDSSPRFAQEAPARIRVLSTCEDSGLTRLTRRGAR